MARPAGHGRLCGMPMREECKFFESRTYANRETVRKCDLDLAPEAPWRCPDNCPAYTPRMADVNWAHGSLITPPTPPEPPGIGEDPSIAALLDEAEDIVNAAVPRVRAELDEAGQRRPGIVSARGVRRLGRWFGRRRKDG